MQCSNVTAVVDQIVGNCAPRGARGLGCHDRFDLFAAQAAALHDTLHLYGFRYINDGNPIATRTVAARLHQQRDHQHHVWRGGRGRHCGIAARADHRVKNAFKALTDRRIAEHQRTHRRAVERAIGANHLRAERLLQRRNRIAAPRSQLVRDEVRIDNRGTQCSEALGRGTLSAADTTSQSYDEGARQHVNQRAGVQFVRGALGTRDEVSLEKPAS